MTITRPLPAPTADTEAYWQAAMEGRLIIQRCSTCKKYQFYPRAFCISCLSDDIDWCDASGLGRIYTFTVCHIAGNAAMKDKTPYAIAMIDLDEGVRMLTEIIDSDTTEINVGARVEVVFEKISAEPALEEFALPQFRLTTRR